MGTDKIVFEKGAVVASRDLEDAGELPGEVVDVLLHDFYKVAWPTGQTTTVHVDRLRAVADDWSGSQVKP